MSPQTDSGVDGMCILKPTTEEKRTGSPGQPGLVPARLIARVMKNSFLIGKVMAISLIEMDSLQHGDGIFQMFCPV